MATFLKDRRIEFRGFGPSILVPQMRGRTRSVTLSNDRLLTRKLLREKCPLVPGIYGWLDHNRQLVYVGKSKSLRLRLLGYFAKNPSDPKMKRIRQHSDRIVWEPISHELLALVRESELIHRWRPEFNSMGQPTRMQPAFVCIGGQPAPNARLVRRLNESHKLVYGPISGTKRLRMAIECLNQIFQLRDCADKTKFEFKNQKFLFDDHKSAKCIRFELGTCPAPCAGLCSRQHYQSNVDALISFLNGDSTVIIDQAEQQMSTLAERQSYESAAIYRDYLKHLKWLDRRLHGLRMAEENLNGLLPIAARKGRPGWLALQGGRISRTFSVSATPGHEEKIASDIAEIISCGDSRPNNLLAMSLQLIVIAWLKKNPSMKNEIIPFHSAANHLAESAGLHSRQSA